MGLRLRKTQVYEKTMAALHSSPRYLSSCGGTRSGKTFSVLQILVLAALNDKTPTLTSIVSETFPHLRRGAIRDFKAVLGENWEDDAWSKTESTYTFPSGSVIEFFSTDSPAKVHGPARDRLFINEAQNISYDVARQLFVRTKGLIICDYNPTHSFWLNEIIESQDNCVRVHSTYLDNMDRITGESMLTAEQIAEIESNKRDTNWWRVYGEGKVGTLEGLIYEDFELIDAMPDPSSLVEVYGIDFGFTNDPTALVRCLIDTRRKALYVDELCYRKGMLNSDIVAELRSQNIQRTATIFADSAEPKSIAEIGMYGFNIKPCYKATSRTEQVSHIKQYKLHITKQSLNLIQEARNYLWKADKDGRRLNEPQDGNDHALDAMRYAVFTQMGNFRKPTTGGKPRTAAAW